jgi:phthalate 4,5-dioxygenase oxygenase subunit
VVSTRGAVTDWQTRTQISTDTAPRLEIEDTPYGFRYAAIRTPNVDGATKDCVRVTLWAFPFISMIPRPLEPNKPYLVAVFVPVDDVRTMLYSIFVSQDGTALSTPAVREENYAFPGQHLDANWFRLATESNKYLQDRAAMQRGDWTGIGGFIHQDAACSESMGAIVDRTEEHLGSSDRAIARVRRRLLESVRRVADGKDPLGIDGSIVHAQLRSAQFVIERVQPWQRALEVTPA